MSRYTYEVDLAIDGLGDSLLIASGGASLAIQGSSAVVMPTPWQVQLQLLEPGQDVSSPVGGPTQRITRLGARWQAKFSQLPALDAATARALISLRTAARTAADTISFLWPQPAYTGSFSASVGSAGQLGSLLAVSGAAPGAVLPAGTFFSLAYNGRNNLHCTTAAATANGSGAATLQIAPMLRGSPAAAAGLAIALPAIEGFIQGQSEDWTLQVLQWTGLPAFTVTEAG